MNIGYFKDYHFKPNELSEQYTVGINIGFHSRFELGVRLAISPDEPGDSPIFDAYFDRMLNGKLVLIKEKDFLPQVAFGIQDIVGTRYHNSTYLVVSKNIIFNRSYSFLLNLGYGTKANDLIFAEAKYHNFIGLFGGTEVGFKKKIYLMAEYDARNINTGLKVAVQDWLNLHFSLLNMEVPSFGLSLKFTL